VPEPLLESELFGHTRGAFTGADRAHAGVFEQADGGTLFLDEIGEASPAIQAKLLRVLEAREVRPLGATAARHVDVRVVSATNRDLRRDVDDGRFRRDLLYRLCVFPIVVPPLRERGEDVAALAEHFVGRFAREEKKALAGFERETIGVMERYAWPGNVRELQNEIRRLVVCAEPGARIAPAALDPRIRSEGPPGTAAPLRDIVRQVETSVIQSRLREHGYQREAAARSLGMRRESLWKKLRALGIVAPDSDEST
jgi:two-component system response regulator HupR/HoxA